MFDGSHETYRFGRFSLHPSRHALYLEEAEVALTPKSYEVLLYLARNPGRVVTKEELLKAVWSDAFIEESNLAQQIFRLRKAFEVEPGSANLIRTVSGRGYQFTADVTHVPLKSIASEPLFSATETSSGYAVERFRERTHIVVEEYAPAIPAPRTSPRITRRGLLLAATTAAVALAIAGILYWRKAHAPIPARHEIVLADFENRTSDSVFDFVLKNALAIDLQQSPELTVLSSAQVRTTLKAMERSPDEPLTRPLALEVCERNSDKAVLTGTIIRLERNYVVFLDATDCHTGAVFAALQAQATDKDAVLQALDDLDNRMRAKLGESLQSIQGFDVPLQKVTTTSFDALVAYSRGVALGSNSESVPYYQQAIQLDPNFAMAYEGLGVFYGNTADISVAKAAFAKAYELHQPLDAYEQFRITSRYYEIVQDDLDLAAKNYELWTRSYPLDRWVWATLANTYTQMGLYTQAIAAGERSRAIDPNFPFAYNVLARAYKRASQFDKAKAICQEALDRKLDSWGVHSILFQVAAATHDEASMTRETEWDKGTSTHNQTLENAAYAAATLGQQSRAEDIFNQAMRAAPAEIAKDYVFEVAADRAETEELLGYNAKSHASAVTVPADREEISFQAGYNAALTGDAAYTRRVIEEEKKSPATSTLVRQVRIPLLEAAIALHEGRSAQAISLVQPAKVYEMRDYYVPTLLGRTFLEEHKPQEAIAEFNEILANPGIDPVSPMLSVAHLGLARAYAMGGQNADSRKEYEAFFALWHSADPDVPVLKQARVEYSRLQ